MHAKIVYLASLMNLVVSKSRKKGCVKEELRVRIRSVQYCNFYVFTHSFFIKFSTYTNQAVSYLLQLKTKRQFKYFMLWSSIYIFVIKNLHNIPCSIQFNIRIVSKLYKKFSYVNFYFSDAKRWKINFHFTFTFTFLYS